MDVTVLGFARMRTGGARRVRPRLQPPPARPARCLLPRAPPLYHALYWSRCARPARGTTASPPSSRAAGRGAAPGGRACKPGDSNAGLKAGFNAGLNALWGPLMIAPLASGPRRPCRCRGSPQRRRGRFLEVEPQSSRLRLRPRNVSNIESSRGRTRRRSRSSTQRLRPTLSVCAARRGGSVRERSWPSMSKRAAAARTPVSSATSRRSSHTSVFGERGRHARSAVGTNALPLGVPVEIEAIFEVRD